MTAWTPKRPQNVAYLDLTGSHAFKVLKYSTIKNIWVMHI